MIKQFHSRSEVPLLATTVLLFQRNIAPCLNKIKNSDIDAVKAETWTSIWGKNFKNAFQLHIIVQ